MRYRQILVACDLYSGELSGEEVQRLACSAQGLFEEVKGTLVVPLRLQPLQHTATGK